MSNSKKIEGPASDDRPVPPPEPRPDLAPTPDSPWSRAPAGVAGALMMVAFGIQAWEDGSIVMAIGALVGLGIVLRQTVFDPPEPTWSEEDLRVWNELRRGGGIDLHRESQPVTRTEALVRIEEALALVGGNRRQRWGIFALAATAGTGMVGWAAWSTGRMVIPDAALPFAVAVAAITAGLMTFWTHRALSREEESRQALLKQLDAVREWPGEEIPVGAIDPHLLTPPPAPRPDSAAPPSPPAASDEPPPSTS